MKNEDELQARLQNDHLGKECFKKTTDIINLRNRVERLEMENEEGLQVQISMQKQVIREIAERQRVQIQMERIRKIAERTRLQMLMEEARDGCGIPREERSDEDDWSVVSGS